jgi:LysR family transcriptional regulator, cyn operon transcriptional activator
MNLQQLRYLVATVDHGTMTAAAAALHVSQPALTRGVRALEQELGQVLLARSGRRVVPTVLGRDVADAARRALAELDGIVRLADVGTCRVVATETQARELCAPAAGAVLSEGGVPLQLTTADLAADVAAIVAAGGADIGVCDLPVPGDLRVERLGWQEAVLLCPAGWDLADPLPLAELDAIPLLVPSTGSTRRALLDDGLAAIGVRPSVAFESDRPDLGAPLVRAGVGAAFVFAGPETAAASGVRAVRLDPPVTRPVGYVRRPGRLSPAARRFVGALRARAAVVLLGEPAGASDRR